MAGCTIVGSVDGQDEQARVPLSRLRALYNAASDYLIKKEQAERREKAA